MDLSFLSAIPEVSPYIGYLSALIAIASIVLKVMPAPASTSGWYATVYSIIHWVSLAKGPAPVTAPTTVKEP